MMNQANIKRFRGGMVVDSGEILQRLEEIEARAARATPGPWESDGVRVYSDYSRCRYNLVADCDLELAIKGTEPQLPQDPDFIAHAREDVPWLCRVMRELIAQNAAMREALEAALNEISEALDGQLCDAAGERARSPIERKIMASLRFDAGLSLLARLHKLEKVAEAARELLEFLPDSMNGEDWEWAWDQLYADSQEQVKEVRERARKALAVLEEEK